MTKLQLVHPEQGLIDVHWVTSDTHFGHQNIIRFCDRPYRSVGEMDYDLLHRWNSVVSPEDTVLHLGDLALGPIEESLQVASMLNGRRLLVPGNHDRVSSVQSTARRERFRPMYEDAGFEVLPETVSLLIDNTEVLASHYPYHRDHTEKARHERLRPVDTGLPLVHGHTHSTHVFFDSSKREFHVGVEAHEHLPVHANVLVEWIRDLNR